MSEAEKDEAPWDRFMKWIKSLFEVPELVEDCTFGCRVDDPVQMEVINGLPYCEDCAYWMKASPHLRVPS